jgi:hypothetical protein
MDWNALKSWARQPTTIHALGAIAAGLVGAISHMLGASEEISFGCSLAAYALTHAGINDSTASRSVEQLIQDAAQAYVKKSWVTMVPMLMADAENIAVAFTPPKSPAPAPQPTPAASSPVNVAGAPLAAIALMLGAVALSACASGPTPAQIKADADAIMQSLNRAVPLIMAAENVPAPVQAKIAADMAQAQAALLEIESIVSGQPVGPVTIKTLEAAVNDIVTIATTPPISALIPPQVEQPLLEVSIALPLLEAEIAQFTPPPIAN